MKPQVHRNRSDGKWRLPFEITEDVGEASHASLGAMTFRSFTPTRVTPVFCYGSLLPMQGRAHVMQDAPCLGPAILQGAELYDLGCFPGIQLVADEDKLVVGMLYEVDDALLANLDHIEGYRAADEEHSILQAHPGDDPARQDLLLKIGMRSAGHQPWSEREQRLLQMLAYQVDAQQYQKQSGEAFLQGLSPELQSE